MKCSQCMVNPTERFLKPLRNSRITSNVGFTDQNPASRVFCIEPTTCSLILIISVRSEWCFFLFFFLLQFSKRICLAVEKLARATGRRSCSRVEICATWWNVRFSNLKGKNLLIYTGIPGVTLCFCTGSYTFAGHRLLSMGKFLNNFLDFFHFWRNCWSWPKDYLIILWSIFVMTLT